MAESQSSQLAPSSDLFDGEILPEELIAIYNEAVGEGSTPAGHHNEEIPALPPQPDTGTTSTNVGKTEDTVHPGARVAETAARLDDGMGVFQNSSSYNDLTKLLTPSGKPSSKPPPANDATKKPTQPPPAQTVTLKQQLPAATAVAPTPATALAVASQPAVVANPAASAAKRKAPTALVSTQVKKPATIAPAPAVNHNTNPASGGAPSTPPTAAPKQPQTLVAGPTNHAPAKQPSHAATSVPPATVPSAPSAPHPAPVLSAPAPVLPKKAAVVDKACMESQKSSSNAVLPETAVSAPKAKQQQPPPAPKSAATEADFKTVAQAAVSSLILSTKNGDVPAAGKSDAPGQASVNTSTAHIKALTGSNWVAACSGAGAAAVSAGGTGAGTAAAAAAALTAADANKTNNRSKRQNLTADERARQNRDRNREHARNTRLRKKAYVEELKRTLTELVAQRDKADLEKRQAAQREVEQREVRFRVIEEFLKLRGRNEANYASWAAILDANFSLTLPATDFRAMVSGGQTIDTNDGPGVKLEKVLTGVHEAMNESNSFALFLQSLGGDSEASQYAPVGFVYNCDRNNFFMDDSHAVLDWSAGTVGITKRGSQSEVTMRGSIRASFCPASNKLLSASIMFDTGAVLSQLQEFMTIPSSGYEADAQEASHRADAILDSLQMPQLDKPTIVPQGESSDEGP